MFIIMHIYVRMVFRKDIKNITFDYEKYQIFAISSDTLTYTL